MTRATKAVSGVAAAATVGVAALLVLSGPTGTQGGGMTSGSMEEWVGRWSRTSDEGCAASYPTEIVFRPGGVYEAPGASELGLRLQSGDYEPTDDGGLRMQAANDAMLRYSVRERSAEGFTLEDPAGCVVRYRRAG